MKSLHNLIKLNDKKLDELRQNLGALYNELEKLEKIILVLKNQLAKEAKFVEDNPEYSRSFPIFLQTNLDNQANIEKLIEDTNNKINLVMDQIFEVFSDKKKYEIILKIKLEEELKKEKAIETKFLDEIAINRYIKGD